MNKLRFILLFCALVCANISFAQMGVGTAFPNAAAALHVTSANKNMGLLFPDVSLTIDTSAAPLSAKVAGMTVYNTATAGAAPYSVRPGLYYNDGSKWINVSDVTLQNVSLTNETTPAGTTGKVIYNTNNSGGLPIGPAYWNGAKWVTITQSAYATITGVAMRSPSDDNLISIGLNGNTAVALPQHTALPADVTLAANNAELTFVNGGTYHFSYGLSVTLSASTTTGISLNGTIDEISKSTGGGLLSGVSNLTGETIMTIPAGGKVSLVRATLLSLGVLSGSARLTFERLQ